MDSLFWTFSVSGVETYLFLPPLVALVVSFFTSMGGVSGAFLLLPFQVSYLHFVTPSVSATNFVYNIVAIPSGVYRYLKEGRMAWPLTWVVILGALPGVFLGYYLRILYLPDPRVFKLFVGCVLLYIGVRILYEMTPRSQKGKKQMKALEDKFNQRVRELRETQNAMVNAGLPPEAVIKTICFNLSRVEYEFWGERFSFSTPAMALLAFIVGIIGGTYGIGGGAIIAPFLRGRFPFAGLYRGRRRPAGDLPDFHRRSNLLQPHPQPRRPDHRSGLVAGISLRCRRVHRNIPGGQGPEICSPEIYQIIPGDHNHLSGPAIHSSILFIGGFPSSEPGYIRV